MESDADPRGHRGSARCRAALRQFALWLASVAVLQQVFAAPPVEETPPRPLIETNSHTMPTRDSEAPLPGLGASSGPRFAPDSSLLAILPDTQHYSRRYPYVFASQTAWIARHAAVSDIRYVFHLGDIVARNAASEWRDAALAMRRLHGIVPYAIVPGNHDYGPHGCATTRETGLNDYFPFAEHAAQPTFGGAFQPGRMENTFHMFDAGGHHFLVLALEWGPRDAVIDWANAVMTAHADRLGLLVTHAYLFHDNRRHDHTRPEFNQRFNPHDYHTPGGVNDGEELWQKLVRHHRFVMTFNGHVTGSGTGYLASRTDLGNTCHQMLSNYQMRALGGEGYMRLIELQADGQTVIVHTYSPLLHTSLPDPDQHFSFRLDE
ncbi:MAG: metallophosphoesterase [Nannocystaceae bacterium]